MELTNALIINHRYLFNDLIFQMHTRTATMMIKSTEADKRV